jgi:hypothetical protein
MKVYISCHHPDPANELATALAAAGHKIVSKWHDSLDPRPASDDAAAWLKAADRNIMAIESADALVVVASSEHLSREKCVPGGKFFEAGYAHGLRKDDGTFAVRVFTLGGVENGMLYTSSIRHAKDVAELLTMLAN